MVVFTVSAPGKAILHGEHAVVYGKGAIAVSLGLRTSATVTAEGQQNLRMKFHSLNIEMSWKLPERIDVAFADDPGLDVIPFSESYLKDVCNLFHISEADGSKERQAVRSFLYLYSAMTQRYGNCVPKGASISLSSELPIGAGLGSSASCAVVLSAALLCLYGQVPNSPDISNDNLNLINKWAFEVERIMHGKPSGIDNSTCTYGGALFFQLGKIVEKIPRLPEIKILLINTQVPRDTKTLVAGVRHKVNQYPEVLEPVLSSIEAISVRQWSALKAGSSLGSIDTGNCINKDLVTMNHHLLNCIGVGHCKLDQAIQVAASLNLAAKLTGAGGGGCAIVFLNLDSEVDEISGIFRKAGFNISQADLAGKGVSFQ